MKRHEKMAKSEIKEPDYEFKTKRQIVAELEHAPEPELQDETGSFRTLLDRFIYCEPLT